MEPASTLVFVQTGCHHTGRGQLPLAPEREQGRERGRGRRRRRTPPEDSFIYAPENVQRPCFSGCPSGSHSVRGATFRIVSSFTFFPRGSRLLGPRQRLLSLAAPWREVSSGPCARCLQSGAWAEFSGFAFGWSGQHQCTHHTKPRVGSRPGAGGCRGRRVPLWVAKDSTGSAAVSRGSAGRAAT